MFEDFTSHIVSNIPLLVISVVMFFLAIKNFRIRKRESIYFILFTSIVMILSILVEGGTHSINHGSIVGATIFTSFVYILRAVLLYIFVLLVNMGQKRSKNFFILWAIPLGINLIINLFPLFLNVPGLSTFVFSYRSVSDGTLEFVRGSFLSFTSYFVLAIYLGLIIYVSTSRFHGIHWHDGLMIVICVVAIVSTVVAEIITGKNNLLDLVFDVCGMVNYIFIISVNAARDPLTGLYDRRTYNEDVARYKESINGVVQIDMNGLKYLNDHFGHDAGDKALNTLATIFADSVDAKHMCAYRLSGDEFVVLMFKGSKEQLDNAVNVIKERINNSNYSAALGYYYIKKNSTATFEEAMRIAEELMYVDKSEHYKNSSNNRRKE